MFIQKKVLIFFLLVLFIFGCGNAESNAKKNSGTPDIEKYSFTLTSIDGEEIELSSLKGKVVFIDFFATWCGPCKVAIPHLSDLYNKYNDKGFEVIALSNESANLLSSFRDRMNIPYNILVDNKNVFVTYGVRSIPALFMFNKEGNIVNKEIGFRPGMERKLEEEINKLLSE